MKKLLTICSLLLFAAVVLASPARIQELKTQLRGTDNPALIKQIKLELNSLLELYPPARTAPLDDVGAANDLCGDAELLAIGATTSGSTLDATWDDAPECNDIANTAPGVWYSVVGNNHVLQASTCNQANFDTKISVYTGSCEELECVTANDDDFDNCSSFTSNAQWCAEDGVTYLILVHGFDEDTGDFDLSINELAPCNLPPPANDLCADAIPLAIPSSTPGSTTYATLDGAPECIYDVDHNGVGVWYSLIGNGSEITLSTCDESTDYDTRISVFTGDCAELICEAANDDDSGCEISTLESTVTFCSEIGVVYKVMVHGWNDNSGNFVLSVTGSDFFCQCFLPDTLHINFFDELPLCQCLEICADRLLTLCFDDLSAHEQPTAWTITPGCSAEGEDERIPNEGCDNPDCPPAFPQVFEEWNYTEEHGWCLTLISSTAGCFCFCLDDILPVELQNFAAIPGDGEIRLNWSTASETENDHFDIERDGAVVGRVNALNSAGGSTYSWNESGLTNGQTYNYELVSVSLTGVRDHLAVASATPSHSAAQISEYALHQNYPNPFNPETSILFDLAEAGEVSLTVFNSLGQEVMQLASGSMEAGRHSVSFDGSGLTSGLYFYRLEAGDFHAIRKMILMK